MSIMSSLPPVSRRRPLDRTGSPEMVVLGISADASVRDLLQKTLKYEKVLATQDFAEALTLASSETPDVALVDLTIGEGAGLSLVHHLRAICPNVAVFVLASKSSLDIAAHALSLGGAGLLMLPLSGDDVLSAVFGVKQKLVDKLQRERLERTASMTARATGWIARVSELSESLDRPSAAKELCEILAEVTGALGAAVYLTGDAPRELVLGASIATLEDAPLRGTEKQILESYARPKRLLSLPLGSRNVGAGYALLHEAKPASTDASAEADPPIDGIIRVLATVGATALAMLAEREKAARGGAAIKDPTSSAYSFAYYVDVAGREIGRARRYGRRFAILTTVVEPSEHADEASTHTDLAERLLEAANDTDVLARVDENEFHFLLPETSGLGAHACRRRILKGTLTSRNAQNAEGALLIGGAAFPHDGQDLGKLLRVARLRAEASKASVVHKLDPETTAIPDLLEMLTWETVNAAPGQKLAAVQPIELSSAEAQALATSIIADTIRGGAATVVVAHHPDLTLGAAVRAAVAHDNADVTLHLLDLRPVPGCERIEALAVIAEHGAYALLARVDGGVLHGAHAADPLLADVLAERLGKAVGVRVFG